MGFSPLPIHSTYRCPERFEKGAFIPERTLNICYDPFPEDPRATYDPFGHMVCFHARHNLGDTTDLRSADFSSWREMEEYLTKEYDAVVILPVYLLDHGGLSVRTTPFPDGWDSGRIGLIYATKDDVEKAYGTAEMTPDLRANVERALRGEVEIYDAYLQGDAYVYVLAGPGGTPLESCGGYYGEDGIKSILEDVAKPNGCVL